MSATNQEQLLHDTQARLQAVLDMSVDGIITIDEHGIIESMNRAAEQLFGYSAEEAVGQNIRMFMPSPFREEHDRYLSAYLSTGVAKIIGKGREVIGKRKDGTTFPMELTVRETLLRGRRYFMGFTRDVSQRKRYEEDLLELSTPILEIWESVLVMPLIGTLGSRRAQDALDKALIHLCETRSQVLIVDITGVPTVDTMVANHLIRLTTAVRLMGAECILTGIRPVMAQTIVRLGIDISSIKTRSSLDQGLQLAIELVEQYQGRR